MRGADDGIEMRFIWSGAAWRAMGARKNRIPRRAPVRRGDNVTTTRRLRSRGYTRAHEMHNIMHARRRYRRTARVGTITGGGGTGAGEFKF